MKFVLYLLYFLPHAKLSFSLADDGVFVKMLKEPLLLSNPIVVTFKSCDNQVAMFKSVNSENMGFISVIQNERLQTINFKLSPIIFIAETKQNVEEALNIIDYNNLGTKKDILIIVEKNNAMDNIDVDIRINQNIYFLSIESLILTESYKINGFLIINTVGSYFISNVTKNWSFHFFDKNWASDVGKRRTNFYGQHLVGITINEPPFSSINEAYLKEATFFSNNGTYDVTGFFDGGLAYDVMKELAYNLNFTYSMYARNDSIWGDVRGNTSTGMVHNIAHGDADIGASMFALIESRRTGMDYPPGIHWFKPSIFIQREQPEQLTWDMFFLPFSVDLWTMILLVAVGFATWLFLSNTDMSLSKGKQKVILHSPFSAICTK